MRSLFKTCLPVKHYIWGPLVLNIKPFALLSVTNMIGIAIIPSPENIAQSGKPFFLPNQEPK